MNSMEITREQAITDILSTYRLFIEVSKFVLKGEIPTSENRAKTPDHVFKVLKALGVTQQEIDDAVK